jgi:hypothetical protein
LHKISDVMARGVGVERRLRRAQRYTCGQLRGAGFMQLSRRAADLPTGILAASRRFWAGLVSEFSESEI